MKKEILIIAFVSSNHENSEYLVKNILNVQNNNKSLSKVIVDSYDVKNKELLVKYNIVNIPTILFITNGVVCETLFGNQSLLHLDNSLNKILNNNDNT